MAKKVANAVNGACCLISKARLIDGFIIIFVYILSFFSHYPYTRFYGSAPLLLFEFYTILYWAHLKNRNAGIFYTNINKQLNNEESNTLLSYVNVDGVVKKPIYPVMDLRGFINPDFLYCLKAARSYHLPYFIMYGSYRKYNNNSFLRVPWPINLNAVYTVSGKCNNDYYARPVSTVWSNNGTDFCVIANHIFSLPGTDHPIEILRVKHEDKDNNHFYSSAIIHWGDGFCRTKAVIGWEQ